MWGVSLLTLRSTLQMRVWRKGVEGTGLPMTDRRHLREKQGCAPGMSRTGVFPFASGCRQVHLGKPSLLENSLQDVQPERPLVMTGEGPAQVVCKPRS